MMHEMTKEMIAVSIANGETEERARKFECGCCEKKLNPETLVWAHMTTGGKWFKTEALPAGEVSQGWFPVGATCYRKNAKAYK